MAELEDEEEEGSARGSDLPEEFDLGLSFVISGIETNFNYPVLVLQDVIDPEKHCECVAVTRVDGKLLLAVPERGWHKKRVHRKIAPSALTKAVRVVCAGCPAAARDEPEAVPTLKAWLGLLDPTLEALLTNEAEAGLVFPLDAAGSPFVPYAPALVAVAQDHFAFVTAYEGGEAGEMKVRMEKLEDGLVQVLTELGRLRQPTKVTGLAATPKPAAAKSQKQVATAAAPAGLNAALVQQALHAGVSQQALAEVSALLGGVPANKMTAADAPDFKELTSDDEEEEPTAGASGSADPVGQAVVHLSKIVSEMRKEKLKKKDKGLESILDHAESGAPRDAAPSSSSRSHMAALRSLQKLLDQQPHLLYREIEKLMAEDWQTGGAMPGVAMMPTTARGWLEHRSKIGNYVGAIRPAWIMAGAWDDLRQGNADRARARLALGVAAYDQQAYDRGSWLLAGEMSLEHPPPYGSFGAHQPPDVWETPHTRLIDGRWFDLLISKLRSLADYQEKKAKLNPGKGKAEEGQPKAEPTKKPQAKQGGKGGGKKGGKGEEQATPTPPSQTTS